MRFHLKGEMQKKNYTLRFHHGQTFWVLISLFFSKNLQPARSSFNISNGIACLIAKRRLLMYFNQFIHVIHFDLSKGGQNSLSLETTCINLFTVCEFNSAVYFLLV